jgi:hypothetical protein
VESYFADLLIEISRLLSKDRGLLNVIETLENLWIDEKSLNRKRLKVST